MAKKSNNPDVFLRAEAALAALPSDAAIVLLMRHGEKEPPKEDGSEQELSPRGMTDSKIMGRVLMDGIVRVEHSDMIRTRQTAENITQGAKFSEAIDENPMLQGEGFAYDREAITDGKQTAGGFPELMDSLAVNDSYVGFNPMRASMLNMMAQLLSAAKPGINVSVSHDWMLYLLLVAIGVKTQSFSHEHVNYLEPLFLWQEGERVLYHYRNKQGVCDAALGKVLEKKQ